MFISGWPCIRRYMIRLWCAISDIWAQDNFLLCISDSESPTMIIAMNPLDGAVAVPPATSSSRSSAHPLMLKQSVLKPATSAYVCKGEKEQHDATYLSQPGWGFWFTVAASLSGLKDVRGWRGHCVGPGRTAPPGLYVLPWTSYYFDAHVRYLNFF